MPPAVVLGSPAVLSNKIHPQSKRPAPAGPTPSPDLGVHVCISVGSDLGASWSPPDTNRTQLEPLCGLGLPSGEGLGLCWGGHHIGPSLQQGSGSRAGPGIVGFCLTGLDTPATPLSDPKATLSIPLRTPHQ